MLEYGKVDLKPVTYQRYVEQVTATLELIDRAHESDNLTLARMWLSVLIAFVKAAKVLGLMEEEK